MNKPLIFELEKGLYLNVYEGDEVKQCEVWCEEGEVVQELREYFKEGE